MANPTKNPHFWDILEGIVKQVPYKVMAYNYGISVATISNYKDRFIETVVRIKDNVVDDTQLKFSFMYDNWTNSDKEYFDFNKDSTFFRKRKSQ